MTDRLMHGTRTTPSIPFAHLLIRFVLEIAILTGFGVWGWHLGWGGITGVVIAAAMIVGAALTWGTFATPGDPSRGRAVVPVPGWTRLLIELALCGLCAYGVWTSWSRSAAESLVTALALHYAVTWERVWWLIRAPGRRDSPEE